MTRGRQDVDQGFFEKALTALLHYRPTSRATIWSVLPGLFSRITEEDRERKRGTWTVEGCTLLGKEVREEDKKRMT